MIGFLFGSLSLVSLLLGNTGKRDAAFKIESANGAGFVVERGTSMKTTGAGTTKFLLIASVVARGSPTLNQSRTGSTLICPTRKIPVNYS